MPKDLNIIYRYKKVKPTANYTSVHIAVLMANPIKKIDDWKKSCFKPLKALIKKTYYLPQNRRCAYCRKRLNADGYFNHLDHIIPKSHHKGWMFKPKNLAITCEVCNPLKHAGDTLATGFRSTKFPKKKTGFTIFNPHFDNWEDCFEIEDGMFIKGKNKKGEETIRVCKLHQYQYSVQFTEESEVNPSSAIKRALHRQSNFPTNSIEYKSAKKVVEYYTQLI